MTIQDLFDKMDEVYGEDNWERVDIPAFIVRAKEEEEGKLKQRRDEQKQDLDYDKHQDEQAEEVNPEDDPEWNYFVEKRNLSSAIRGNFSLEEKAEVIVDTLGAVKAGALANHIKKLNDKRYGNCNPGTNK